MSRFFRTFYDKLLLAMAAVMVVVGCVWMWQQQTGVRRLRAQPVMVRLSGSEYEPAAWRLADAVTAVWPQPVAQSNGNGWLYELFTPPAIYYNPAAQSFTVTASLHPADGGIPFGLELIGVKLEPYRLQLAGYFGEPGDYLAAFTSSSLPETLLAREGCRWEKLGLTLKSFTVKQVVVAHNDAGPVYDVAAFAVMQDEKTGADVELDSRTRKLTDKPLAVFELATGEGRLCELSEGDTVSDDLSTYRIERIQLDPPEVAVARQVPGLPLPESKVLRPVLKNPRPTAGKPAKSTRLPGSPTAGLATNDN